MSRCRSCDAPIMWATTPSGQPMPIDPKPVPGGILHLDHHDPKGPRVTVAPDAPGPKYTSHFATCAFADQHRKRAASSGPT